MVGNRVGKNRSGNFFNICQLNVVMILTYYRNKSSPTKTRFLKQNIKKSDQKMAKSSKSVSIELVKVLNGPQ